MKTSLLRMMRSILLPVLITTVGVALVSVVHRCTEARIAAHARMLPLQRLQSVLPASGYDNDILSTERRLEAGNWNGGRPALIYLARREGKPVAAVFDLITPEGYSGPIRLLVGVYYDGTVSGVRVISHRETPGLGDAIEADKSDWIRQFAGQSLREPPIEGWQVALYGGAFDQISGATITSRGVVGAIRRALLYFADRKRALFSVSDKPSSARDG